MISTQNLKDLVNKDILQKICKAISVLDAIISPEFDSRYYSYNSKWYEDEEVFEMNNGSGNQMLILFRNDGCIINGFNHEKREPDKSEITKNMPEIFREFIFGEPINSIGTTFCIWTTDQQNWQTGDIKDYNDGSKDLLSIFDNNPETYINWAEEYFGDKCKTGGILVEAVKKIYNGEILTKEMVLSITDKVKSWKNLESDLKEINYQFDFES